jgi:uncharacterized protein (DUF885 family)
MSRWLVALVLVLGCGSSRSPAPEPAPAPQVERQPDADAAFAAVADRLYRAHFEFRPHQAIRLGLHEHDGRVPDRSPAAIEAEIARLTGARRELEAIDPEPLSAASRLDREVLLGELRKELFELVERRWPQRSPIVYLLFDFSLEPYIDRDYAPLEQRMTALLGACRGAPAYYQQMRANLDARLARPALQVGVMMAGGTVRLVDQVIRAQVAALPEGQLRADLDACLDALVAGLVEVRDDLAARMPEATDDFALGEEQFLRMLSETQGIDTDLASLERIGRADLERNLAAIEAAAREIDPKRPVREVIAEAAADKPDDILAEATAQLATLRTFIAEHDLASIPSAGSVEVRASPPHKRGNMASLSSAGAFEERPLPSFYYLSPPDPSWPEAEQRAYLPSRADLLFLSVHEVWPGHFLQNSHIAAHGSPILKSFETYSSSEGWAHYVEEMMLDAGLGAGDPRVRIGQLKNALLRNVRYLVALGLHTGDMTLDQAIAQFQEFAFTDPQTARQQALRGTGDPMYLSYTLGKLVIRKLHDDWRAANPGTYSPRAFHDALLRHGEAPLGAVRRSMLGPDAGPLL